MGAVVFRERIVFDDIAAYDIPPGNDLSPHEQGGDFRARVVFNAFGFAFDVFVCAFAFLTKGGELARRDGDDTGVEAVRPLDDDEFVAAQLKRALGQQDIAFKRMGVVAIIDRGFVGGDVDGLVTVGCVVGLGKHAGRAQDEQAGEQKRNERAGHDEFRGPRGISTLVLPRNSSVPMMLSARRPSPCAIELLRLILTGSSLAACWVSCQYIWVSASTCTSASVSVGLR